MRTILIPTDFTVNSLIAVKKVMNINENDPVKIVLFHGVNLSDSITDLLLFSKGRLIREMATQSFKDACEIIKNKFAKDLESLYVEVFTGNTPAAFDQFLEANDVDIICYIDNFRYTKPSKNSMDIMPLLSHASVPTFKIEVETPKKPLSQNQLLALFSETI